MQEEETSTTISLCPSFNCYSSNKLSEIATRVTSQSQPNKNDVVDDDDDDDEEFEFSLVRGEFSAETPAAATGDVFYDGPVFPIFNRDLLAGESEEENTNRDVSSPRIRIPLKKLFLDDRDAPSSPSSSEAEADELDGIPPGTYCVWKPKAVPRSPERCEKSNSTGSSSSKRWRLRDLLLRRSNSDGNGGSSSFVFLTPPNKKSEKIEKERRSSGAGEVKVAGKMKVKGVASVAGGAKASSAHEVFYVRNRAMKEGDKRRSYLPYRQDLVGFFANVNGLGRTFPPF